MTNKQPTAAEYKHRQLERIWRRGVCQLAALRAASAGLMFGPTLDDRIAMLDRAREELLQLERADMLYAELSDGRSLLASAERALSDLPPPTSWLEATLARLLVCLSARIELELDHQAGIMEAAALVHEVEHVNAAHAAMIDMGTALSKHSQLTSTFSAEWLVIALQALSGAAARAHYLLALEHEFGLSLPNAANLFPELLTHGES